jgi:hypothetical protein
MTSNWQEEHSKRLSEKQEDFVFEVALMLEEEREWNRSKLREHGILVGVPY